MNKKRILQIVALVVVLSMMFTTAAFAITPGHFKQLERTMNNYEIAANYMKEKAIIKGYGNGDFGFNDYVKRGDIAVMIVRAFKLSTLINEYEESLESLENFKDVFSDDYFYDAILTAKKFGIAKGDGKNFNPKKMVTIEEAIMLIQRSVEVANRNVEVKDVDLYDLFKEDELDDFATRQDVALMLYKVLTGTEYDGDVEGDDEIGVVEYEIDENKVQLFDEEDFEDAFAELKLEENEKLEYVEFNFPVKNGKLYYDYDAEDLSKTLVTEKTNYYVNSDDRKEISLISFVPSKDFNGTVYIKYMAYGDKDTSVEGYIKIIVGDDETVDIEDIKFTINENTVLIFEESDFEDFIDEVVFELPDEEKGTLYLDDDEDGTPESDEMIGKTEVVKDEDLDYIIFEPYQDFTGKLVIKYTAYDEDTTYSGKINIVVKEVQEIEDMDIEDDDFTVEFNFLDELKELIDEDIYNKFDYVKFQLPEEGTLYIDINGTYNEVDSDDEYDIEDIDGLKFESEDEGTFSFDYKAYDYDTNFDNDKQYDGVIKITVEQ